MSATIRVHPTAGDDMYMIGHKAVGPNLDMGSSGGIGEQVEIKFVVTIVEERPFATITALCDMVWNAGDTMRGR